MPLLEAIHFHAPLRAAFLAGTPAPAPVFSEEQMESARREAYQRGVQEATRLLEEQMLSLRHDAIHLQAETFAAVNAQHESLAQHFREALPALAVEVARRVLAETPIEAATVARIAGELLKEIEPSGEPVEVRLAAHDLDLLTGLETTFRERHPSLTFQADAELNPGECVVKSRFGTLDGRVQTKLALAEEALRG